MGSCVIYHLRQSVGLETLRVYVPDLQALRIFKAVLRRDLSGDLDKPKTTKRVKCYFWFCRVLL